MVVTDNSCELDTYVEDNEFVISTKDRDKVEYIITYKEAEILHEQLTKYLEEYKDA